MMMEFKGGMVFKSKNKYYVLALIQNERYLMISDDEIYGWDLHESPNYEQIINSQAYKGYIPVYNGKERKFTTGWWYGERQLIATFTHVRDLDEVKQHFIVKDSILDLYLRVKDDISISLDGVTSVQADEFIESFTEIFKDDDKKEEQKETMSLRTAMEYAELINSKIEEILQILNLLDESSVTYTLTDDYFEVSVDNRHYTITFNKR